VSQPIYYAIKCEEYKHWKFRDFATEKLAERCFLCGKSHPAKFHCYVNRTYRKQADNDDGFVVVIIQVPRFFCEPNYLFQTKTKIKKQYTITILPGFLIPYSTIPVNPVHEALNSYITKTMWKRLEAAIRMTCASVISFRLFFSRVAERLEGWIDLLVKLVIDASGEVMGPETGRKVHRDPKSLQEKWDWFVYLATYYVRLYGRIPNGEVVLEKFLWQYIYCLLSRHKMDLGP